MKDPFPLGRPRDSVEGAAQLFLRYVEQQPLTPDYARSFFMMCKDPQAVRDRVNELTAEAGWSWDASAEAWARS